MDPVITVENLSHSYGSHPSLKGLTFDVNPGEVLALLGPNGAGKTTTVRLLNGLFRPVGGRMQVLGYDPVTRGDEVRRRTGVLTETPALYERLTARQNLEFFAALADMPGGDQKKRVDELLAYFELQARAGDRVTTYSKGVKQRLALARALLTRPQVLFLDEPTSGLDPEAAQQVHELIDTIRRSDGHTVFLCTHNLTEAERLCDRVAVMNRGRFLALGSLDDLRARISPGLWIEITFWQPPGASANILTHLADVLTVEETSPSLWRVHVATEEAIPLVVGQLVQSGCQLLAVRPQKASLEQIYFTLQNADTEVAA